MNVIYIVYGSTGISEYIEWNVCAFLEYEAANKFCDTANQWLIDNKLHISNFKFNSDTDKLRPPFDKSYNNYNGTIYEVQEIPILTGEQI